MGAICDERRPTPSFVTIFPTFQQGRKFKGASLTEQS